MTRTVASASAVSSWAATGRAGSGRRPETSARATRTIPVTRVMPLETVRDIAVLLPCLLEVEIPGQQQDHQDDQNDGRRREPDRSIATVAPAAAKADLQDDE